MADPSYLADEPVAVFTTARLVVYVVVVAFALVAIVVAKLMWSDAPEPEPRRYRRGREMPGAPGPVELPPGPLPPNDGLDCEPAKIEFGEIPHAVAWPSAWREGGRAY